MYAIRSYYEHAAVRHEAAETSLVIPGEPERRITAGAGADRGDMFRVDVRLFEHHIRACENILHGHAAPVLADGVVPVLPEAGESAAVGGDDDVALRSYNFV